MKGILPTLGVVGFDDTETAILATLVSQDPLLLIGRSGTGKTHLLNSLSEALGLEHRHYNASLVSFDDLVGFPYPKEGERGIEFLETPATVWPAESVLVDEISRCKPEHQNRLFSLIHERRIQGILIPHLKYRWAAMNPCSLDADGDYAGSEPLDRALADRFAVIVPAVDWADLSDEEQSRVADPSGEDAVNTPRPDLICQMARWRETFLDLSNRCPSAIVGYSRAATSALNLAGITVSPRRARMLTRSLLAAEIVAGGISESLYQRILKLSLPQPAWGEVVPEEKVKAAHRAAWDAVMTVGPQRWIHQFHLTERIDRKVKMILDGPPDAETAGIAICQFLATGPRLPAAAFAFALYPAVIEGRVAVGGAAMSDLGKRASPILAIDRMIHWTVPASRQDATHPGFVIAAPLLEQLKGARRERAKQLFYWALAENLDLENLMQVESEFDRCVAMLRKGGKR